MPEVSPPAGEQVTLATASLDLGQRLEIEPWPKPSCREVIAATEEDPSSLGVTLRQLVD
jgi:hypothetical protein